ncbi:hypothetical protein N2152v2_010955 [Parachlorella kessleri]
MQAAAPGTYVELRQQAELDSPPAVLKARDADNRENGSAAETPGWRSQEPSHEQQQLHVKRAALHLRFAGWSRSYSQGDGLGGCWGSMAAGCDDRSRTTVMVNFAAIMERVDEQLLPALYRNVGESFHATPSQLGILTLSRAMVQALASPLAGVLGHYINRIVVLTLGAAVWGTMTAMFSGCNSIKQGIPFWAMNGVGLSFLIPTAQSLVADYNVSGHRGKAFGLLHFTGAVGGFLGALYATNIGGLQVMGIEGWRFAFLTVAAASWLIGVLTWLLAVDPRYTLDERYRVEQASDLAEVSARETAREIWQVLTIPSFIIIITQGIMGSMPWNALVFLTFYFQLLGMSDFQASLLLAVFLATNAIGGLVGGFLGDWAASRWPRHGRVVVCQISVAAGVPLSLLLFKGLPLSSGGGAMAAYTVVLGTTGLLITWADTACNNPILSEICLVHLRNLVYSFDRSFEGAIAACGAPLVGWLAERAFGFTGTAETSADIEANMQKARSLGNALLVFTTIPWALCALFFSGLHWTYPRDKLWAEEQIRRAHPVSMELVETHGAAEEDGGVSKDEERQRLTLRTDSAQTEHGWVVREGSLEETVEVPLH